MSDPLDSSNKTSDLIYYASMMAKMNVPFDDPRMGILTTQLTMWPQVIFDLTSKGVSIKILQDKKTIKYELCIKKALTLKDIKTKSEILFNWVGSIIDSTWTIQLFIKNGSKQKIKKMAERSSKPLDEKLYLKDAPFPTPMSEFKRYKINANVRINEDPILSKKIL